MSLAGRRSVLKLAAGAALLPLLASQRADAAEAAPPATDTIEPPTHEMVYRRRMERRLVDGAMLAVTREFAVTFQPVAAGYLVLGRQLGVQVDVPPQLAQLARYEEQRVETGIFPLALDRQGLIVDGEDTELSAQFTAALDDVRRRFAGDPGEVRTLLEALHSTGSQLTARLPRDLFAPLVAEQDQRQQIALPWGDSGEVRVHFSATRCPQTRLMRQARREVTTRLDGDERLSREHWDLFTPGEA